MIHQEGRSTFLYLKAMQPKLQNKILITCLTILLPEAVVSPTPVVPMPSTHSVNLLLASANYPTALAAPNPQRPNKVVQEICVKSQIQKAKKGNTKIGEYQIINRQLI